MKTISMRDLQKNVKECVEAAQGEMVVVTHYGNPAAIIRGCRNYDWEDIYWMNNKELWRQISRSRKRDKYIPLERVKEELLGRGRRKARRK